MNTIPPDEHLRQALRHAPDADLAPPREVSVQILAAAHRSAAELPQTEAPTGSAWRRWIVTIWHRPAASAALASVLMAGLIGLLWRAEVPGPASEVAPAQPASTPEAKRSDEPLRTALTAAAPAAEPQVPRAVAPAPLATAKAPSEYAAAAPSRANATQRAAGNAGRAQGPVLRTQPAEIAPVQPDRPASTDPATRAEIHISEAQAPAAPAGRALRAAAAGGPTPESTTAPRDATASLAAADAASGPPWQAPFKAGDQWQWQPQGALRDPDATWWAALASATLGRWQVAADAHPVAGSVRLDGQRGSERVGQLWLEPASVLWCGAVPPCQRAWLPAESRRVLLDRLAR